MEIGRKSSLAMLSLVAMLLVGCEKPAQPASSSTVSPQQPAPPTGKAETILQLHWLGKKRISADTNATNFMAIWNLPETARLETQTLDKLSTAPWRLLRNAMAISNAPTMLLRPLLDDVVREESCFEIRRATNQPAEIVLAIRLDDVRIKLWVTNLAAVAESLTKVRTTFRAGGWGWSLKKHDAPDLIEMTREGDWLLAGAATKTNTLLADFRARIARNHTPCARSMTNIWLDADVDLARVAQVISADWKLPENTPHVSMAVNGDDGNVCTAGELKFPKPLPLEFEPWNMPTNLIDSSFTGFTAVRGIRPWLTSLESSNKVFADPPPNQFVVWSYAGAPAETWFAAPMADAGNQVRHFGGWLGERFNTMLAKTDCGSVVWLNDSKRVRWLDMPFMPAFIRTVQTNGSDFVFGGTLDGVEVWSPPPQQMLQDITGKTNLFYYDWEITGQRSFTWLYISQLLRMASGKSQLPADFASIAWLKAIEPKLGNCATAVTLTDPAMLTLSRQSTLGLSALELNLLVDWLESPQFPRGLHTFLATPPALPGLTMPPQ